MSFTIDDVQHSALSRFAERAGRDSPFAAMASECADLLRTTGQVAPPIALHPICRKLNAEVVEAPIATPGRLEVTADRYRIVVPPDPRRWRATRFSIAHEIGHILLYRALADDPDAIRQLISGHSWREAERLCNWAAGELLLPADGWENITPPDLGPETLPKWRDRFAVSFPPIVIRLVGLRPELHVSSWAHLARNHSESVAWRLRASYSSARDVWLPTGLSTKHLDPDLVQEAAELGESLVRRVRLSLRRSWEVSGIGKAVKWDQDRGVESLPLDVPHSTKISERRVVLFIWRELTVAVAQFPFSQEDQLELPW